MTHPGGQAGSDAAGSHLVLYDGVCGLCNRLLVFLLEHDRRRVFQFASLQSPTGQSMVRRWGGNPDDLTTFYVFANYRTPDAQFFTKSRAALFVAGMLGWPWKLAAVGRALPTAILDRVYDLVARHRYRVFGRYDQCVLPRPEHKGRFVD